FARALVAIFSRGSDFDGLGNRVIGALGSKRACRVFILRSRGICHQLLNARRALGGRNFSRNRLQYPPDIPRENLLTRRIWMNPIRLIQAWVAADALEKIRNQRGTVFRCKGGVKLAKRE